VVQLIEGVLSQSQRDSLEIEDFIFHIIDPDADERVIFLDEVDLHAKQRDFFLARLKDIAEGTQYKFLEDAVHLKKPCVEIVNTPSQFIELSRNITTDFAGRHKGQMSAGVFVIATVKYLVTANNWQKLVFLVKMDKRPSFSYSYKLKDGKRVASMSEIENALSEAKSAIQKSALIDISDVFAWDVLALDQIKKPLLGEYYQGFLGVTERQSDSSLTRNTHSTVKKWARKLTREQIPEDQDALDYIGRAFNYLVDHDTFVTDDFINAVVKDDNHDRKASLKSLLREDLATAGINGQTFRPQAGSIAKKEKKQVYKTEEGVIIIFEGDKTTVGLSTKDLGNNRKRITIETGNLIIE
jgi:hypothetical protein